MRVRIPPRFKIASSNGRTFAYVLLSFVPRFCIADAFVQTWKTTGGGRNGYFDPSLREAVGSNPARGLRDPDARLASTESNTVTFVPRS